MCDQLRQSFTFLPGRSEPRVWISKPVESGVNEFIRRRGVRTAALSIKGPAKNELRRTIMFSSHSSKPMVDQNGLPDTGPGNDRNDVDFLLCPCTVQKSDVLLSTKDVASCNRQSADGNLLRTQSG